ncbi:autotransporter domain-containing protein [Achromobacter animicus]|uniref:autotransporter domain-containing protein n=1 Tax=Achromobacter animicus TaxID=1389935 RepID=UPI0028A61AC8|nr:autotransporter domain-containing protein [Achromobacter animicus]
MNKTFRSIWNQALGAWVAVPEIARARGKGAAGSGAGMEDVEVRAIPRIRGLSLAIAAAFSVLVVAVPLSAQAACDPFVANQTTNCAGIITTGITTPVNNLTVNVLAGALVTPGLGQTTAVNLNGNNVRFSNAGEIDPSGIGLVSLLTSGVTIGNSNNSVVNISNSGTMRGTGDVQSPTSPAVTGVALAVRNGASGTTTITNTGNIGSKGLLGLTLNDADTPVVAVYGGSRVSMTNTLGATITGRVAFQANATGNTFTNAGSINGSVSLGAGGGNNTFVAVTGSSVWGLGVASATPILGLNVSYAPTGQIDGGVGGSNLLKLENNTNSGTAGSGAISSANYTNFSRLEVNSGTWTMMGQVLTGSTSTALNGGALSITNSAAFGAGAISANGGTLKASLDGLTVANTISLGDNGLTVAGTADLTLSGPISGSGSLIKSDTSTLTLNQNSNAYTGKTELQGGTLAFYNLAALGSGSIKVSGVSTLNPLAQMEIGKDIELGSSLAVNSSDDLTLSGVISGSQGGLVKQNNNTLTITGSNTFVGGVTLDGGQLSVSRDANLGAAQGDLIFNGGKLVATGTFASNRAVSLLQTGQIDVAEATEVSLAGPVTGNAVLEKLGAGVLVLSGNNSYAGTNVLAGKLVGSSASIRGDLYNQGAVIFNQEVNGTYSGAITGTGAIAKMGSSTLTLSGSSTNDWTIEAGTLRTTSDVYKGNAQINSQGILRFEQDTDGAYAGQVFGSGLLAKAGSGLLTLQGDNSGFIGGTEIKAGTLVVNNALGGSASVLGGSLLVNGTLDGNVDVSNAGLIGGGGNINGSLTLNGGVLAGKQGQTLTVGRDLTLSQTSQIIVAMGANTTTNSLFKVGGDLALAGTLNVTDLGGFGAGVYRLFDYTGALTSNTLALGSVPGGVSTDNLRIQTAVAGQINLANTSGAQLSFWDGGNTALHDNKSIDGGTGTWRADGQNWTSIDATVNGKYQPNPTFAVFQGAAGTVTVDASAGAIGVTGMQLASDGYRIEGDSIALAGAGGETIIRVGAAAPIFVRAVPDANVIGTIAAELTGDSKLAKTDTGTLVLAANNSYTGGTEIRSGVLSISKDSNLGAATGGLTFNGGKLLTTGSFVSERAITLSQAGQIEVAAGTELGLQGAIAGNALLEKSGAGTLVLTGNNSYAGTNVLAGTLVGNTASIQGDLYNTGSVVFNQSVDGNFSGAVTGTGTMAKRGSGSLTLSGQNALDWTVETGTLLANADVFKGNASIAADGALRFKQTTDTTYGGKLAGAGLFAKTGSGTLTLSADSSAFTGLSEVKDGTLVVASKLGGSASVLGGRLQVDGILSGNATGSNLGVVTGTGTIGGNLTLTGGALEGKHGQTLSVGGALALSQDSQINVALGGTSTATLFKVGGDLTLDGTLNVTDQGGFGAGVYRLFNYGGTLTNNGLAVGSTPASVAASDLYVQTAVNGQVNLTSTGGATLGFWDGAESSKHDNGVVDGGSGVWTASGRNWTDVDGAINGRLQPAPTFAIFQGTAGTVTVSNADGDVAVTGMQLASDGYRITGDSIALQGAGGETIIRVGAGQIFARTVSADPVVTATIESKLTGASKLIKTDTGTLVLTADNSYTGGTEVRSGVLSVAKDSNLGNVDGNLTLSGGTLATTGSFTTDRSVAVTASSGLDVAADTAFNVASKLTGSGNLTKTGGGVLNLSGNGSAYSGNVSVQSGGLNVAAGSVLGGAVNVASGSWLSGSGQVGTTTLQSGAVLTPGAMTGPLKVAGDLTFSPGSIYAVSADPASSLSSRVDVTGLATLAGSVVHIGPEGNFATTRQYTILTANSVNGTFDTVSSNYAYLNPTLSYTDKNVTLQLERKQVTPNTPIRFEDAANTSNQRSVAKALDSLPSGSALHEYILTLPEGLPPEVFNSLTGEAHASVVSNLLGGTSSPRTLPMQRLRLNLNAGMSPGAPTAQAGGPLPASALPSSNAQPAWAELVGNWQTQKDNGNSAQVRQHTGGVFIGADHEVGHSGWRLGGAVGYTDSKIRVDDRSSQADVSGYSATLYGGKSFAVGAGKLNFLAGAAYTWHDVSTKRYASVAGEQEKLMADYGANTTQLFTELGYSMSLTDSTRLEPFVGFAWSDLRTRGFSESGGSAALSGQSSSDKQTSSTLGLRTQTDFKLGSAEARLHAMAGWRHAFGGLASVSTLAFEGSQSFTVAGTPIARNAALAELGAEMAMSRDTTLALTYSGQYGGGNREHAGSLNVRWRY